MSSRLAYLGLFAGLLQSVCAQQCLSFDETPSVFLMCSSVVDYAFYVPASYSAADLDAIAQSKLNSSMLALLPPTCLGTLKSLVCSAVFSRCIDDVDLSDYATYDSFSYNGSDAYLPFSRPCRSSCESTISTCGALLSLFEIDINCDDINPQTSLPMYSNGTTDGECHTSPEDGSAVSVQSTHEVYLGSEDGACSAMGYSEIFVPPAQKVNEALAPLQPSYVIQTLIEQSLSSSLAGLPLFLTEECNAAIRSWFCASYFMPAERVTVEPIATYLPDLYLPQYPAREVCLEYKTSCFEFIEQAKDGNPSLDVDCYQIDADINDYKFPLLGEKRLIAAVTLPYYGTILLETDANSMESSQIGEEYETTCPYGFVVPEKPDHPRVNWIPGSGCAVQCPFPFFTPNEFESIFNLLTALSYISQVLFAFVFATYYMFPEKRKSGKMFLAFAVFIFLENFVTWIQMITSSKYEDTVCSTNATGSGQEDGEFCTYVGAIVMWSIRAGFLIWTFQAIDLFLRVVLQKKGIDHYFNYYLIASLIIATGFLIGLASRGALGYGDGHTTCALAGDGYDMEAFLLYPDTVSHTIGTLFTAVTLVVMFGITRKSSDGTAISWKRNLKIFRTPLAFLFVFLAATLGFAIYEWKLHTESHIYKGSLISWTQCIFGEFARLTGEGGKVVADDYLNICGDKPKIAPPMSAIIWNCCAVAGSGIVVFIITINGEVIGKWMGLFGFGSKHMNPKSISPEEVELTTTTSSTTRKAVV